MTLRDQLDPDVAKAIEIIPFHEMNAEVLPSLRGHFELPVSGAVERADHMVPGDPEVPLRLHRPKGDSRVLPCVYSMHGGGYVIGSYAIDGPPFRSRARRPSRSSASATWRTGSAGSWRAESHDGSITTRIAPAARSSATRNASAASSIGKRCVITARAISGCSASIDAVSSISRRPPSRRQ